MTVNPWRWQRFGENWWYFGKKVRGAIREPLAEVRWSEFATGYREGWEWKVIPSDIVVFGKRKGVEDTPGKAMNAAENTLGLTGVDP